MDYPRIVDPWYIAIEFDREYGPFLQWRFHLYISHLRLYSPIQIQFFYYLPAHFVICSAQLLKIVHLGQRVSFMSSFYPLVWPMTRRTSFQTCALHLVHHTPLWRKQTENKFLATNNLSLNSWSSSKDGWICPGKGSSTFTYHCVRIRITAKESRIPCEQWALQVPSFWCPWPPQDAYRLSQRDRDSTRWFFPHLQAIVWNPELFHETIYQTSA